MVLLLKYEKVERDWRGLARAEVKRPKRRNFMMAAIVCGMICKSMVLVESDLPEHEVVASYINMLRQI